MASLYATIYYDKWQAVTEMRAISLQEKRKLACALLDYACFCFGLEPDYLSNAALSMFNVIKTSLGARRHRGGQIGNTNAKKEKTNDKTNTENEYPKRISETNTENELVTSDTEHVQSLTKTETDTESFVLEKPSLKVSPKTKQEKEKAYAKEKSGDGTQLKPWTLGVCPKCGNPLEPHLRLAVCRNCSLMFKISPEGDIITEKMPTDADISSLKNKFAARRWPRK